MDRNRRQQFEEAFVDDKGRCKVTCHCGATYYNNFDYIEWEDGELEEMEASDKAFGVSHFIGTLTLEGRQYVDCCDCWLKHAEKVMNFIDDHARAIATYLTLEKKRKQEEADKSPVVE